MEIYSGKKAYLNDLDARGLLPRGFRTSVSQIDFAPAEMPGSTRMPMNLTYIALDKPSDAFAGVFTKNAFPGAPVYIGKRRMAGSSLKGILINNKVANVSTPGGIEDAEEIVAELARLDGGTAAQYLPSSTGVIGWRLPVTDMKRALSGLVDGLRGGVVTDAARAIMTTDAYPKVRSAEIGNGRIVAIAKGAGMIEPNMATMLVFILTDIDLPREALQSALESTVARSFNTISVDGDQSTSDTAIILSSKTAGTVAVEDFQKALDATCIPLAEDIVRNGEGTAHVVKVAVTGAKTDDDALGFGKAVINSPLVKTAVYGNDPNVGRILMAIGDYAGNTETLIDPGDTTIRICGHEVYRGGVFNLGPDTEAAVSESLKQAMLKTTDLGYPAHDICVDIEINVGAGAGNGRVIGSDLSYEYVKENADYRT